MNLPNVHIIRIANYGGSSTVAFVFCGKVFQMLAGPDELMDKLFQ